MSSQNHIPHAVFKSAFGVADKMEPLGKRKNPAVSATLGFFTGGVGIGIYHQSWLDFFVPLFVLLLLVIVSGGTLLPFAPAFWAIYGYRRAKVSNEKLDGGGNAECIIDAEVITEPPPIPANQKRIAPDSHPPLQARLRRIDELFSEGVLSKAERDQKRAEIQQAL